MNALRDNFSRIIDYLRLSVTDRCNLRCLYCMPPEGVTVLGHRDILSYEEIIRIVAIAAALGVRKVRLTGGEPLCRKNLPFLVSSIKKIKGIEDLSLTTNGTLLEWNAQELADAGLDRVNISIDSLQPERYRKITRGGSLAAALNGLAAADKAGLKPIKINMIPMKGINEDEIVEFAKITLDSHYHVRFIECMPSADIDFWNPEKYTTTDEIKGIIERISPLSPVRVRKNGPSKYFRLSGAKGVVGFISALSHHFCGDCNRLRLTSDGRLRPCLFSETEIDLLSPLRSGATDSEIERLLRLSIQIKPEGHHMVSSRIDKKSVPDFLSPGRKRKRPMSRIGG
jgi:cyclic pyranopterin phosphate synthase